jgi:hypothetical protein
MKTALNILSNFNRSSFRKKNSNITKECYRKNSQTDFIVQLGYLILANMESWQVHFNNFYHSFKSLEKQAAILFYFQNKYQFSLMQIDIFIRQNSPADFEEIKSFFHQPSLEMVNEIKKDVVLFFSAQKLLDGEKISFHFTDDEKRKIDRILHTPPLIDLICKEKIIADLMGMTLIPRSLLFEKSNEAYFEKVIHVKDGVYLTKITSPTEAAHMVVVVKKEELFYLIDPNQTFINGHSICVKKENFSVFFKNFMNENFSEILPNYSLFLFEMSLKPA